MKLYNFEAKTGRTYKTYYVRAKNFKTAYAKFSRAYPKADIRTFWVSRFEELPVIVK